MTTTPASLTTEPHHRRRVLGPAMRRTWESGRVFFTVTVINAAIQALLILPTPIFGVDTALFVTLAVVSYVVLLAAFTLIMGAALDSGTGATTLRRSYARMRPRLVPFLATTTGWTVAVIIALLFWTLPGFMLLALTPFVVLAAADGSERPVRANFRAIKHRFWRYLAVLLVTIILLFVMFVGATALTFFVGGSIAAFLTWLYLGFVGSWLISGWALLWRSTRQPDPTDA